MIVTPVDLALAIDKAHGGCSVEQLRVARNYVRAGEYPASEAKFMVPIIKQLEAQKHG